ncbi:hypothetical protein G6F46_006857 [Rhizopus delemar]|uniref:Coiled-coil domain-containing protein 6 n=2 Tax=Rhizopus TaxID=4842 RepID=A0A9P7CPG9_9FUNG|nr:hypothetical protein G6F55_005457 [Rhizopus delemar]KAG1542945.1 hypothetical protein G6F51_006970 [Rhizopus arrhizus]KAG1496857.1 hypothetical protein G6F54_006179 [Rhizopus delemar]KAG1510561.1 hypothetical protein G6F53_006593 [Rhizopus delemar]KAG1522491.1 hypothetical protein G6F52_005813 [Rhizopus delemar]
MNELQSKSSDIEDNKLLTEIKENEKQLTKSLREQLEQVRKDKAVLEQDLQTRTKAYEIKLGSVKSSDELEKLMNIQDLNQLKSEAKELLEKSVDQENRLKKLEFELEVEKGHVKILKHDNKALKQIAVEMNAVAEQEEEYISNKLLKRISGLKKEKSELLLQVEQEEEYMTNMLQKKLNQLQREKIDMENSLEQEQEYIVNKLQKQLDSLRAQQSNSYESNTLSPVISKKPSKEAIDIQSSTAETLLSEIAILKNKTIEMEKEFLIKLQQCNKYKGELIQLRKQAGLPTDDIPLDEGIPNVFRTVPPSPNRGGILRRSTSSSSQRSLASEKNNNIPPLQLDTNDAPLRSRSNSASSRKENKKAQGNLLSLANQH